MNLEKRLPLTGGTDHGQKVDGSNSTSNSDVDKQISAEPAVEPETDVKLDFDGDEVGDGTESSAARSDGETESEKLDRWRLSRKVFFPKD